MNDHERCKYCETVLEMTAPDGKVWRFTAHTVEFCRDSMFALLRAYREALKQAQEREAHIAQQYSRALGR